MKLFSTKKNDENKTFLRSSNKNNALHNPTNIHNKLKRQGSILIFFLQKPATTKEEVEVEVSNKIENQTRCVSKLGQIN